MPATGEGTPGHEASESDLEAAVDVPVTKLTRKPAGRRKSRLGSRNSPGLQSLPSQERSNHPPHVKPPVEPEGGVSEQGVPAKTRQEAVGAEGEGTAAQFGYEVVQNGSGAATAVATLPPEVTPPVPVLGESATEAGDGGHVDQGFAGVGVTPEDVAAPRELSVEAVKEEQDQASAGEVAGQPEIAGGGTDLGKLAAPEGAQVEASNEVGSSALPLANAAQPSSVAPGDASQGVGGEAKLANEPEPVKEPERECSGQATAAAPPAAVAAFVHTDVISGVVAPEVAPKVEIMGRGLEDGETVEDPHPSTAIGDTEMPDVKTEAHGTQPGGQSDAVQVETGVPAERRELKPRKRQRIVSGDGVKAEGEF